MVYEQITFLIKNLIFYIFFGIEKTIFGSKKNRNRNRIEPEPDRTGTGLNRSRPKPNRTEPNRGIPVDCSMKTTRIGTGFELEPERSGTNRTETETNRTVAIQYEPKSV